MRCLPTLARPLVWWMASLVVCAVSACGGSGCGRGEARYSETDAGELFDGGQDFSVINGYLDERVAGGLQGFAMQVVDAEGRVVFRREEGRCMSSLCPDGDPEYSVQLVTSVASSTKWVTSTAVLAALDEGVAAGRWASVGDALDTPVAAELGCGEVTGPAGAITVRHLLSFTSGLIADHACVNSRDTLQDCACSIVRDSVAAMTSDTGASTRRDSAHPPGTTYKYGASHLSVAGAWLERAFDESWESLFERLVRAPLAIDMQYTRDSNLAGSIWTSVADFTRYVDALRSDARGLAPKRLLSADAVREQRAVQASAADPSLVWLIKPESGVDYGLNTWRWCTREFSVEEALGAVESLAELRDPGCDDVFMYGHSGKGGFAPSMDAEGRYGLVFAMRQDSPGSGADYTPEELGLIARIRLLTHKAMVP